jgi:MscS family membrane protein
MVQSSSPVRAALLAALVIAMPVAGRAQGGVADAARGQSPATEASPVEVAPDSPRASVIAFLEASRTGRWQEAARHLVLPADLAPRGPELAERLKVVLDRHLWIDVDQVSPASSGRTDDGLAPGVEEVGVLRIGDQAATPLRLVRVVEADSIHWGFATATVQQIDTWYASLEGRWLMDLLVRYRLDALLRSGPFDLMWWQWIALLVASVAAWAGGRLLGGVTRAVLRRVSAHTDTTWDDRLLVSVGPPISVGWGLFVFAVLGHSIGLSLRSEGIIEQSVRAAVVATVFWALWRSVNVLVDFLLSRPWAADNPSARHLFTIGANLAKGVIAGLGVLALLAAFGFQVTTVLAGLGIGGLALAFGAQKTVENLFGSMALAVDQPFRVGDFVRVGDFTGTVEDIGLRSTRFRTPDRTLISIPNGSLADQRLESLAERDRMRLATVIGLEYRTTRPQIEQVLAGFRRVLESHPRIWRDTIIVAFSQFGASSLDIEVVAWFQTESPLEFNHYRQEVLLDFMRVVEEAGTSFAFPTRTVHLVRETTGAPVDRA